MIRPYAVHPAMQAATPKAVALVGVTASGNRGYKISCLDWVWLSPADKLKSAINVNPRNPQGALKAIEQHCNVKISKGVSPAGQADLPPADMTFDTHGNSFDAATGTAYDANGNVISDTTAGTATTLPQEPNPTELPPAYSSNTPSATNPIITASTNFGPTGNVTSTTSGNTTSTPLLTPQQETALFSAVGNILNVTGQSIAAAIQANNQQQLAQMQARTQVEIATLQTEAQRSQAAGNISLAQQQLGQMSSLQQFSGILNAQTQSTTMIYVAAGVAVLALIGAVIIFMPRSSSQAMLLPAAISPKPSRVSRSTTRPKR